MPWETNGEWERMPMGDPLTVAKSDQIIAGAKDRMANARSFLLFSVPADANDPVCDVSGIVEPEAIHEEDSEAVMRTMCLMMVRMWFDGCEGDIEHAMMTLQLIRNVQGAIAQELQRKGYLPND
jgi:hypothetical protein